MKVILSRKGFDSANGKIPSPILEDGTMLSFPIPSSDHERFDSLACGDVTYAKLLSDLKYRGGETCHLDPDLDASRRTRQIPGWVPAFGQINSSASYLKNIGLQEGDLFLFFGNFHRVQSRDGAYSYCRRSGDFYRDNDLQVIWGYLQVGKILDAPEAQKALWWHPHSCMDRISDPTNVIFTASEHLSFSPEKPGAGLLPFAEKRVLTAKGCRKATWKPNAVYDPAHIIGRRRNSAQNPSAGIYYAGIWQELGLKESEACSLWAKSMLE